jgi:hypothetical protein
VNPRRNFGRQMTSFIRLDYKDSVFFLFLPLRILSVLKEEAEACSSVSVTVDISYALSLSLEKSPKPVSILEEKNNVLT